jgi:hypothetical protein
MTHTIAVREGRLEFIFSDDLACLLPLGAARVTRASAVEPTRMGDGIGWIATMVDDGVALGPYATRQDALDAEVAHLKTMLGL